MTWLIVRGRRPLDEAHHARSVAEEATAAKDAVLDVVAHDLRNPLQTISLAAEMLSESRETSPTVASRVYPIQRAAERARRLVENILDTAKAVGAPLPIVPELVPLSTLIEESISPLESEAEGRHIHLEGPPAVDVRGSLVCDRDRIVQVLWTSSYMPSTASGTAEAPVTEAVWACGSRSRSSKDMVAAASRARAWNAHVLRLAATAVGRIERRGGVSEAAQCRPDQTRARRRPT